MTDQNPEVQVQPATEVVDDINFDNMTIDDTIVNDDGVVIQFHNKAENKVYYRKGNEPAEAPATQAEESGDSSKSESTDAPDEPAPAEEYENLAHHMLKIGGYEGDKIKLGDKEVSIADLSAEEQLEVAQEEFGNILDRYEARIKELETKKPELKLNDPHAQQILEYLQKGGDVKALAKEILSSDPAARANMLSDEEIVKLQIKTTNPKYSDKDVEDEFKEMSESMRARRAKSYREQMKEMKPDLSHLTKAQQDAIAAEELQYRQAFDADVTHLKTETAKVKEIAGIPIRDDMRNYLLSQVTPKDFKSDSKFVEDIAGNPSKLFALKFWDTWGEKIIKQTQDVFYKRGLADAQKGKEKLSDTPLKTYGARGAASGSPAAPAKDITEMSPEEFDKWVNAGVTKF